MRLVSGGLLLDMMIVRREGCSGPVAVRALSQVPTVNFSLFSRCIGDTEDCLIRSNIGLPRNLDATAKAPLTPANRGPYSSLCYLQRHSSNFEGIDTIRVVEEKEMTKDREEVMELSD